LPNKISKALRYAKKHGFIPMVRKALIDLISGSNGNLPHVNLTYMSKYDELIGPSFGKKVGLDQLDKKTINWFIPPVAKGSGGHLNIFRFIRNLEDLGYKNTIVIVCEPQPQSAEEAKNNIQQWFFPLKAVVYIDDGTEIPPAFFAMATEWRTAYFVKRYLSCVQKCYFVQDFEPWFYPTGTDFIFAENTYRFGFYGFTAGTWLAKKLAEEYGMSTISLGFSFDRDLYTFNSSEAVDYEKKNAPQKVFFYARPPTTRRAFELGMLVLREVARIKPDITIVLVGWDMSGYKVPFEYEHAGLVELNQLSQLYIQCDVALVLSFSNVSLLPLELMACGVPVVSNRAPYTEWLLNETNSVLADPTIESLSQAILSVLENPNLANELRQGGLEFTNQTSWELEASKLADGLEKIANHEIKGIDPR
jgi:glycosyltransferase involved in cell wall biosynthesis